MAYAVAHLKMSQENVCPFQLLQKAVKECRCVSGHNSTQPLRPVKLRTEEVGTPSAVLTYNQFLDVWCAAQIVFSHDTELGLLSGCLNLYVTRVTLAATVSLTVA
jgi:hypothetical protein